MKIFNKQIILGLALLITTSAQAFTDLPDALDCRLTSVSPKGHGATYRRNIQIKKEVYDPTKSVRKQSDYKLYPNQLPLYIYKETADSLTLINGFINPQLHFMPEGNFIRLIVEEGRGGGTGYGTPGFTVTSRYKCVEALN